MQYYLKIYNQPNELPSCWDTSGLPENLFLSAPYFNALTQSPPVNMSCKMIGFYQNNILIGKAIAQCVDVKAVNVSQSNSCIQNSLQNFTFRNFCSHVLFLGNSMLTGQNAFVFNPQVPTHQQSQLIHQAIKQVKQQFNNQGCHIHVTVCKDFDQTDIQKLTHFSGYHQFSTQPCMQMSLPKQWLQEKDYVNALSKKYRDQYKRARKKSEGIIRKQFTLNDCQQHQQAMYNLYKTVQENANFNTFLLTQNHFSALKQQLQDNFTVYGYFNENNTLIGFCTLIHNKPHLEPYFLGYDPLHQKDRMLYLNMLYDMIDFGITHQFSELIFGRTALEIKSSVGALAVPMYGYIKHNQLLVQTFVPRLFECIEPKVQWKTRNPFKEQS